MQDLVEGGLFELQPELGDEDGWKQLANRIVELGYSLDASEDVPDTGKMEVRQAITISRWCFGNGYTLPMAIMLLALKHRKSMDSTTMRVFAEELSGEHILYSIQQFFCF